MGVERSFKGNVHVFYMVSARCLNVVLGMELEAGIKRLLD